MPDLLTRLQAALAERYRLERELGHGGWLTVFLGHDLKHDRPIALKVLHPELAAVLGPERFLREIRIAAQFTHPYILSLHDSGQVEGLLYYIMPYVAGESLRERLLREKQLPLEDALTTTREVSGSVELRTHTCNRAGSPAENNSTGVPPWRHRIGVARAIGVASGEQLADRSRSRNAGLHARSRQQLAVDARPHLPRWAACSHARRPPPSPLPAGARPVAIAEPFTAPNPAAFGTASGAVEPALIKALAGPPTGRSRNFVEALSHAAAVPSPAQSVAVLPFLNLSGNPENDYFADSITEDVIAQLSKIRALKVISRTSVMPFKKREQSALEIGTQLGVATLLEGSVRRARDRVRIVAQLIDVATNRHLWAETYDRELIDIFAIQSDVALRIAVALEAELSPDEQASLKNHAAAGRSQNPEAYEAYLKGRFRWYQHTPGNLRSPCATSSWRCKRIRITPSPMER